jgi:hypothetical protein
MDIVEFALPLLQQFARSSKRLCKQSNDLAQAWALAAAAQQDASIRRAMIVRSAVTK